MNRWRSSRLESFRNAFSGLWFNLRREPNFLIQALIAVLVIIAAIFFRIKSSEWLILILTMGAVLTVEALNTAVEKICDRFLDELDPKVKIIKDSAAGAVLIMALVAVLIGTIIFLPYVRGLFAA